MEIEVDDFRVTFGNGLVQTKADQLDNIRRAMPVGAEYRIFVETSEVRVYGRAAVVTGIVVEGGEFPDRQGVISRLTSVLATPIPGCCNTAAGEWSRHI
jgi:hypothetical protein